MCVRNPHVGPHDCRASILCLQHLHGPVSSKSYFKWCKGIRGHLGVLINNRKKKKVSSAVVPWGILGSRLKQDLMVETLERQDKTHRRTKRRSGRNNQKLFPYPFTGKVLLIRSRENRAYFDNGPKLFHCSGAKAPFLIRGSRVRALTNRGRYSGEGKHRSSIFGQPCNGDYDYLVNENILFPGFQTKGFYYLFKTLLTLLDHSMYVFNFFTVHTRLAVEWGQKFCILLKHLPVRQTICFPAE